MRITPKQFEEIEVVREFGRLGFSSTEPPNHVKIVDDARGYSAYEGYILITVRGITEVSTNDRAGLCLLLWGQRWLNLQIAQYRKDLKEGLITEAELRSWYADRPTTRAFILRSLGIPASFFRLRMESSY